MFRHPVEGSVYIRRRNCAFKTSGSFFWRGKESYETRGGKSPVSCSSKRGIGR